MLDLGIAAFGNDLVAAWKGTGTTTEAVLLVVQRIELGATNEDPWRGQQLGAFAGRVQRKALRRLEGHRRRQRAVVLVVRRVELGPADADPRRGQRHRALAGRVQRQAAPPGGAAAPTSSCGMRGSTGRAGRRRRTSQAWAAPTGPSLAGIERPALRRLEGRRRRRAAVVFVVRRVGWAPQTQVPVGLGRSIGPSLRVGFGNRLYLAYKGAETDSGHRLRVVDGSTWAPAARLSTGRATTIGPSLTVFNNKLYAAWTGSDGDQQLWYSWFDGSSWAVPGGAPPANLHTVVSNGAMLNVGNADLSSLTWGLVTGVPAANNGVIGPSTEEGFWSQPGLGSCEHTVTVNASIKSSSADGPTWTSAQFQGAPRRGLSAPSCKPCANKTASRSTAIL